LNVGLGYGWCAYKTSLQERECLSPLLSASPDQYGAASLHCKRAIPVGRFALCHARWLRIRRIGNTRNPPVLGERVAPEEMARELRPKAVAPAFGKRARRET